MAKNITPNYVGKSVTIKAGSRVTRNGSTTTRKADSIVTVKAQTITRSGKVRVTWKSHGLCARTTL